MKRPSGGLVLVLLVASGCIVEAGNPKKPTAGSAPRNAAPVDAGPATGSFFLADSEPSTMAIAMAMDEAVSAAAELSSNRLTEQKDHCHVLNPGSVEVVKMRGGMRSQILLDLEAATNYAEVRDDREVGVWQLAAPKFLACNSSGHNVALDWEQADGLEYTRQWRNAHSLLVTPTGSGQGLVNSGSWQRSGSRHVVWHIDSAASSVSQLALRKTTTIDSTRTMSIQKGPAEASTQQAHVATDQSRPLQFAIQRDRLSQQYNLRTLLSGRIFLTQDDGTRIEQNFDHLVFTNSDLCMPQSGHVRGSVTEATGMKESFTLDFSPLGASLRYEHREAQVFHPAFCIEGRGKKALSPFAEPEGPAHGSAD